MENNAEQNAGQTTTQRIESEHPYDGEIMNEQDQIKKDLLAHKKKTGITNEDLAHAIGVRPKTLQRLFNGYTETLRMATRMVIKAYLANHRNGKGR